MRKILLLILCTLPIILCAQTNTEIYVFDLLKSDSGYHIQNPVNVTHQNPGYDNQPQFTEQGKLMFVSTRQGQTDVARVDLHDYSWTWLTATPGSEYSPTPIPAGDSFSAINLEPDGTQLLWKYPAKGEPSVIIPELKIGYHCWLNKETLVAFVLGEPATLQVCQAASKKCDIYATNIGRSLHKIPGEKKISFISKANEVWQIKSLDPLSGTIEEIANTLEGSEDMCWAPDGTIFMGQGNKLYALKAGSESQWREVSFKADPIFSSKPNVLQGITRLAINPAGNKIAIVVVQ